MIHRDPKHLLRMTMLETHHGTSVAFADGADDAMGVAHHDPERSHPKRGVQWREAPPTLPVNGEGVKVPLS